MLDEIRGFAIICMIFHHAFLDVGDVIGLEWGYEIFDALCTVQPIFWTIFIVISGMCSRLSRNTVKRGILVLVCAGIITLATAVIMPHFRLCGCRDLFRYSSLLRYVYGHNRSSDAFFQKNRFQNRCSCFTYSVFVCLWN